MTRLEFLRSRVRVRAYLLVTIVILALTMVANFFGFTGSPAIQTMAGALNIVGIPLTIGTVLLNLSLTNRNTRVGRILIRFSYVTLTVVSLCLSMIALTTIISSFLSAFGSTLAIQMATTAFATQITLSITVTALSYYTLPIEGVWSLNHLG